MDENDVTRNASPGMIDGYPYSVLASEFFTQQLSQERPADTRNDRNFDISQPSRMRCQMFPKILL